MLNNRYGMKFARHIPGLVALCMALVFALAPTGAANAQSSHEDRARFVSITRKLEEAPLHADGRADRAWALSWLTDAPDVSVTVCTGPLSDIEDGYPYAGEVVVQYIFAMAALVIEHPETTSDRGAQQAAGVASAVEAYRAIVSSRPDTRSASLDALLAIEARGELPDFVRTRTADCA